MRIRSLFSREETHQIARRRALVDDQSLMAGWFVLDVERVRFDVSDACRMIAKFISCLQTSGKQTFLPRLAVPESDEPLEHHEVAPVLHPGHV